MPLIEHQYFNIDNQQYLNECLEIAQDIGDAQVCGEACRAMAISLQALGDITRSRDFFKMYSETARDANLLSDIASASCDLGEIGICQVGRVCVFRG